MRTVLAAASTLDKDLRQGSTGNTDAASKVGALIAERAKAIAEYKQALSKGGDPGKEGKNRGDYKDFKRGLMKSR